MVIKRSFNERILQIAIVFGVLPVIACSLEPLTANDLERDRLAGNVDAQSMVVDAQSTPVDAQVAPLDSILHPDLAVEGPRDSAQNPDVAPPTCDGTGIMNGEVVSACTMTGLAALVQFGGRRVCSLEGKASFTLTQVPAGCPLLLTVYKPGYVRFSEILVVPTNSSLVKRIKLMPEGGCNAPQPPENGCDCGPGFCSQ